MNFIMICHFYLIGERLRRSNSLQDNLHDQAEYVIHIRNLNQALNHRLVLKNVHRIIKFNQNA